MLEWILFKDPRFDVTDDNNYIDSFTMSTIIVCSNYRVMESLSEEIFKTINGDAEHNEYACDECDVGQAKYVTNFGLQKVIDINGQRITLCLEPAMIYKAKEIHDIWFADSNGDGETYRESIWPMRVFKGSEEIWDKGLDEVYSYIVSGRFGCYDGNWLNI